MAVNLSMLAGAGAQFFDNSGVILSGGLVYTYAAGTTTPQAAYTTSSGSTAHTNPIVLDSAGRVASGGEIWLTDAVAYKFVLKTSAAVTIGTYDNVTGNASGVAAGIYSTFAASSGSSLVGYLPTSGTATTVQAKLRQTVSIKDFGAVGDGTTDDTSAIQAARDYAATRSYAGNTTAITWPAGRYKYTTSPNWAIIALQMNFQGEVWLINDGTGVSFLFDGGATGTGVYGIQIIGFPRIYGNTTSQHGIYLRSIYRSTFEVNVRGAGTTYAGLYGEWCVSNTISFIMNYNEGGLYATPAYGVFLTMRTSGSLQSGWNNFWNPECSGLPVGFYLDGAFGTKIFGGAIQGNTKGLVTTVSAQSTVFYGTDFEGNTTNDTEDAGNDTQFIGCDFDNGPRFVSGAKGLRYLRYLGLRFKLSEGVQYGGFIVGKKTKGAVYILCDLACTGSSQINHRSTFRNRT
jgi:hypothetical protein